MHVGLDVEVGLDLQAEVGRQVRRGTARSPSDIHEQWLCTCFLSTR